MPENLLKTLLTVISAFVCLLCWAAPPDIPALDRYAVKQNFPDAKSVLLYDLEVMTYQKDGTSVETDEFYQKVLTEAGRKELNRIPLHSNTNYGSAEFVDAYILRNGRKITFDLKKHTTFATSAGQMSSNIYDPEMKVTTLTVPGLEIGDTLFIKTVKKTLKPIIPGEWSSINLLESDIPILRYDIVIDAPRELPLRNIVIKDAVGKSVRTYDPEHKNGRIIYRWKALNVPQAIPEPGMPKLYTCCQRLLVGTAKDWQSISKWYYDLCRPRMDAVSDEMRTKVKELTANAPDDDAKIAAVFKYVSQNIRYTGVTAEKNAPGFEPHDVRDTFSQKHGVCRDKAALLVSMLELAGVKAYPALFMAGTPKDSDVPNGYFNHAVVCVDKGNFNYVMMDPTDENTRTLFPEYLANQSFLAARKEGDVLRRTPVISPDKNLMKITTGSSIDDKGTLTGSCQIEMSGINDLIYRSSFSRMTDSKRTEFWQGRLRRALPGATLTELKILPENIRDTSKPVTINFSFSAQNNISHAGKPEVLQTPLFAPFFGTVNWLLPDTALEKRRFPIELDSSCKLVENMTLKLPRTIAVCGIPQKLSGSCGILDWNSSYNLKDGVLTGSFTAVISGETISKEQYIPFKKERQNMDFANKRHPIVKKDYSRLKNSEYAQVFPDSDAVILSSSRLLKLTGERNFTDTVKRRILITSYAGVKKFSELKQYYFPSHEKVDVTAQVTHSDGKVSKLEKSGIRIMDMPWVSYIKTIPGGKIMVAALPSVGIGSVIEYTVKRSGTTVFPVAGVEIAGQHEAVLEWDFTIESPADLKLRTSPIPENAVFTRKMENDTLTRSWKASNIPEVKKEHNQGELRFIAPHISYSAITTSSFAKEYLAALNASAAAIPELAWKSFTAHTDIGKLSQKEAILALRNFILKNVRVAGPAVSQIAPATFGSADEVFKRGVATSPERAALFAAMLKKLGVEYSFFLADKHAFLSRTYSEFQQYCDAGYEAVLVYVPKYNIFLNASTQYAGNGYTPYNGMVGLNLANGSINAIISDTGNHNQLKKEFDIKLNNDGSAIVNITCRYRGSFYEEMNRVLSEMTPELRKRFFDSCANALDSSAKFNGRYSFDFSGTSGVVKYTVTIPRFATVTGKYLSFDLPGFDVLRRYTEVSGKERTTPFVRNSSAEIALEYRIIVPDSWKTPATSSRTIETGDPGISRAVIRRSSTSREIMRSYRLILPAAFVEPCDFDRMINIQNELGRKENRTIILKQESDRIK